MHHPEANFSRRVLALVAQIPMGKVMTYGQIAALCGNAGAARVVGGLAHFGDPTLPWHRVVNKHGGLAAGYPGGRVAHARHLQLEGHVLRDGHDSVDIGSCIWRPYAEETSAT